MNGACRCDESWAGLDCSYSLLGAVLQGEKEEGQELGQRGDEEACLAGCSGHGSCAGGVCFCAKGFGGLSCNMETSCAQGCSTGRGECHNGACICKTGFFGPTCADQRCPNDCFGHGSCDGGSCRCSQGWSGRVCDLQLESNVLCDPPCQNGAPCMNGACYCPQGFFGGDCSLAIPGENADQPLNSLPGAYDQAVFGVAQPSSVTGALRGRTDAVLLQGAGPSSDAQLGLLQNLAQGALFSDSTSNVDTSDLQARTDSLFNKLAKVAQLAGESATKLHAAVETQHYAVQADKAIQAEEASKVALSKAFRAKQRARESIERAVERAWSHSSELPGHEFSHSSTRARKAQQTAVSLVADGYRNTSAQEVKQTSNAPNASSIDDAPQTKVLEMKAQERALVKTATEKRELAQLTAISCEGGCSGHGVCATNGACTCQDGWLGQVCDTPRCAGDCQGRGVCVAQKCVCESMFFGASCQHFRCPEDCSGHGYCFQGQCTCHSSHMGPSCAVEVHPPQVLLMKSANLIKSYQNSSKKEVQTLRAIPKKSAEAAVAVPKNKSAEVAVAVPKTNATLSQISLLSQSLPSYKGTATPTLLSLFSSIAASPPGASALPYATSLKLLCPHPDCSGHGTCTSGRCMCYQGFGGLACAKPVGSCSNSCSAHGTCNELTQKCECSVGWTGTTCQMSSLSLAFKEVDLSPQNHSVVSMVATKSVRKTEGVAGPCGEGGEGAGCPPARRQCQQDCQGRGLCLSGMCLCIKGWGGSDCSLQKSMGQSSARPQVASSLSAALLQASLMGGDRPQSGIRPEKPQQSHVSSLQVSSTMNAATAAQGQHRETYVQEIWPLPEGMKGSSQERHTKVDVLSLDDTPLWEPKLM